MVQHIMTATGSVAKAWLTRTRSVGPVNGGHSVG